MRRILDLLVLKDTRTRRGILHPKKGKNFPQILFQSYLLKNSFSSREVSPQVILHLVKKRNMVRNKDNDIRTSIDSSSSEGNYSDNSHQVWFEIVTEDGKGMANLYFIGRQTVTLKLS